MLVLARKVGERIRIGDDVVLVVLEVNLERRSVRLGVEAPRRVKVLRSELVKPQQLTGECGD